MAPATTFWVEGTPGPLAEGERERAVRWGEHLAVLMVERGRTGRSGQASVRT